MDYEVEAVPADGWEFSHWQVVGRASNNPNDVYNNTLYLTLPIVIDLMLQWNQGIESPLVYLVAHFRPITKQDDTPGDISEPEDAENTTESSYTKQDILRAIDRVRDMVERGM
jgi:hypothetical protein